MPFNDEEMIFNEEADRYVLTAQAANNLGVDIIARLRQKGGADPQLLADNIFNQVSLQIYHYIHSFVLMSSEMAQEFVLKNNYAVRKKLKEAMKQQLLYYLQAGNLSRSLDERHRKLAIDELAKEILDEKIEGLGHSLLYTGCW